MRERRTSRAILLALVCLELVACGNPDKPFRFKFYDFLILSSPVWGILAFLMSFDSGWRARPLNWRDKRKYRGTIRRYLWRFFVVRSVFLALAATGLLIFLLHLLDLLA